MDSHCKKNSGILSITYEQAVELALCFGWIAGVSNALDEKPGYNVLHRANQTANGRKLTRQRLSSLLLKGK